MPSRSCHPYQSVIGEASERRFGRISTAASARYVTMVSESSLVAAHDDDLGGGSRSLDGVGSRAWDRFCTGDWRSDLRSKVSDLSPWEADLRSRVRSIADSMRNTIAGRRRSIEGHHAAHSPMFVEDYEQRHSHWNDDDDLEEDHCFQVNEELSEFREGMMGLFEKWRCEDAILKAARSTEIIKDPHMHSSPVQSNYHGTLPNQDSPSTFDLAPVGNVDDNGEKKGKLLDDSCTEDVKKKGKDSDLEVMSTANDGVEEFTKLDVTREKNSVEGFDTEDLMDAQIGSDNVEESENSEDETSLTVTVVGKRSAATKSKNSGMNVDKNIVNGLDDATLEQDPWTLQAIQGGQKVLVLDSEDEIDEVLDDNSRKEEDNPMIVVQYKGRKSLLIFDPGGGEYDAKLNHVDDGTPAKRVVDKCNIRAGGGVKFRISWYITNECALLASALDFKQKRYSSNKRDVAISKSSKALPGNKVSFHVKINELLIQCDMCSDQKLEKKIKFWHDGGKDKEKWRVVEKDEALFKGSDELCKHALASALRLCGAYANLIRPTDLSIVEEIVLIFDPGGVDIRCDRTVQVCKQAHLVAAIRIKHMGHFYNKLDVANYKCSKGMHEEMIMEVYSYLKKIVFDITLVMRWVRVLASGVENGELLLQKLKMTGRLTEDHVADGVVAEMKLKATVAVDVVACKGLENFNLETIPLEVRPPQEPPLLVAQNVLPTYH